jgi:hypothetical protein
LRPFYNSIVVLYYTSSCKRSTKAKRNIHVDFGIDWKSGEAIQLALLKDQNAAIDNKYLIGRQIEEEKWRRESPIQKYLEDGAVNKF